jgi:hypothetical protein
MARDKLHQIVRNVLEKDGWKITHDPLIFKDKVEGIKYDIDLGAEKVILAEKGVEQIAVEVKSFLDTSLAHEFHGIIGQYLVYEDVLIEFKSPRKLFLAIPVAGYERLKKHRFLLRFLEKHGIKNFVYDEVTAEILTWKE